MLRNHGLKLVDFVEQYLGVVGAVVLHDFWRVAAVDRVNVFLQLPSNCFVQLLRYQRTRTWEMTAVHVYFHAQASMRQSLVWHETWRIGA